jgi:hypothetical protein
VIIASNLSLTVHTIKKIVFNAPFERRASTMSDKSIQSAYRGSIYVRAKIAALLILFGTVGCSVSDALPMPRRVDSDVPDNETGYGQSDAAYGDGGSYARYDSGDIGTKPSTAPTDLSYERRSEVCTVGIEMTDNHARVTGLGVSFVITPALSAGLAFNAANGTISGTPTAARAATEYTVTATNSGGSIAATISIAVNPKASINYEFVRAFYTVDRKIADNHPKWTRSGVSYSVNTPSLPDGLAIDPTTGIISGTPTRESSLVEYTVIAIDSSGSTTEKISIAVCAAPDAHWTFDEGAGEVANDASGHGHTGTLMGEPKPAWITGKVGNYALDFGESEFGVEVPADVLFDAQTFTLAAWLYASDEYSIGAYARRINGWHMRTYSGEWDVVIEGKDDSEMVGSSYRFPHREWHHYVTVVDNSGPSIAFYVDGAKTGQSHAFTQAFSDSTGELYIGQYDADFCWKGAIDDVRFYGKALDSSAIQTLYQGYLSD